MQLQFSKSYAHANLLGSVVSDFFGSHIPGLAEPYAEQFRIPQLATYKVETIDLVAGKYKIDSGVLAPSGSIMIVLEAKLMFWVLAYVKVT